ncbi:MAG: helix-turn-helix domain-containing protein, partial [Vulcanococcus sp.]
GTTRSAISRLEAARKHLPALTTLRRYADALDCDLEINLVPRGLNTTTTPTAG